MKKTALLFMFTIISLMSIYAQQTYIPDANFEAYLETNGMGNGTVNDNYVTTASISGVTTLDVSNQNIADLTGIQDFTSLQSLIANGNQLTAVDISANTSLQYVLVSNNLIQDLTLPTTTTLRQISCNNNQLSSIYLNNVTGLRSLYINHNQLTDLDVSSNTQLTSLQCYNNQLTQLTLNANTALTTLICSSNALTSLDVSSNTQLSYLSCHSNQLTQLNLGTSNTITQIECSNNNLTNLDITGQTAISKVMCFNNDFVHLDFSLLTQLTELIAYNNSQLESVNLQNANNTAIANNKIYLNYNPNLTCVFVDDASWSTTHWHNIDADSHFVENQVQCDYYSQETAIPDQNFEQALIDLSYDDVIDGHVLTCHIDQVTNLTIPNKNIADLTGIEDFAALQTLICSTNALTSLDVSNNTQLSYLSCHTNQLTQLNLGTNNNLSRLFCSTNQLTILNISNQTNLSVLECQNNLLNSLDLSLHTSLTRLMIYNNQLTFLDIKNANNAAIANNSIYLNDNPNLTCIYVDDVTWSETNWTHVDANSHFVETQAQCDALSVNDMQNTGLNIFPNPVDNQLNIVSDTPVNQVRIFDVLGNQLLSLTPNSNIFSMDVSSLATGTYIVRIISNDKTYSYKIIK
jgi:Leucine-rich repeat (LRR) protein